MHKLNLSLLAAAFAAAQFAQAAPACGGHADPKSMLVTPAWVAEHLKDPKLVILQIGPDGTYEKGHIPGSQPIDLEDVALRIGPTGLGTELPPMATLAATLAKMGISNDSRIVLYADSKWFPPMSRVFLTLDAMGLGAHVSVMDGGGAAWLAEGHSMTTETSTPKPGKIETCAQNDVIADLNFMKSNLHHDGVAIFDARSAADYARAGSTRRSRAGHIPGAASLPSEALVDDSGKFKPVAELKNIFASAGVKPGDRVVSYCYVGQRATVVYFVARYLGYDARMFDGSWEEWNKHTELPVEVSAAK